MRMLPLLSLLVPGALMAASHAPAGKLVLLHGVESRVEVDPQGHVVAVQSDATLPPALLSVLEQNVRKIEFAPPLKDGHPVSGVTFVAHDICAAPVDGAYRLAVKYRGNGPSTNMQRVVPAYPRDAMRRGLSGTFKVEYQVGPDGLATVEGVTQTAGSSGRRDLAFNDAITAWVKALRFQPEQLDGQPVGTRIATVVEFSMDSRPMHRPKPADEPSCQVALAAPPPADERIALDSPFKPRNVE